MGANVGPIMQDYKRATTNDVPTHADGLVVDLSKHMNKLMAYEDISDDLTEEEEIRLVEYARNLQKLSYDKISRRYDHWLEADRAHDVYVPADTTKFREKAVMADTRAIADTVLTYMMAALAGRNPMFQLEGLNRKSRVPAAILERVLHQHMRRTGGEAKMAQMFLDSIRYGFAPTKVTWDAKKSTNVTTNFDPRRAFPDPRVQWGDWDRLQFVSFVDYASTSSLLASGQYPKLNKYSALRRCMMSGTGSSWDAHNSYYRDEGRGHNIDPMEATATDSAAGSANFSISRARIVDETWVRLNGYEVGVPGLDQLWMVFTVLDEKVIIRCQLNPYGKQFPVVFGGFHQDAHKTYSQSLYDLLLPMHEISTWMLRSRIDNVQLALQNLIFADPTQINIADLIDRNPWNIVRTLPGVKPGDGLFIANIPDITQSHWQDISMMGDLKQRVSAASDAQQGMPTSDGIRSATEIQRLTQLGSQRLGVLSRIMSATAVRPYADMMIGNLQDAISMSGSIKAPSNQVPGLLAPMVQDGYLDFNVSDLQGSIEYLVVDGTLPIEPTRNAETWMTMLQIINQTGLNMEYNAGRIAEEAIRSMGISDLDQFKISKEEQQQGLTPSQQLSMMEKMRGASVQPNEQVQSELQKGNIIPMSQAR